MVGVYGGCVQVIIVESCDHNYDYCQNEIYRQLS